MSERDVAVVTGASMGIGEAFAGALAERGYDLALVARSGPVLERIAGRLRDVYGGRVEVFVADLADAAEVSRVAGEIEARLAHVDLLVNNAGFGAHGPFESIDAQREVGQIRVNIEALVALTNRFAPAMLARGRGGIINVASTAAFQPVPYMAVYAATKAFVLSFTEALAAEFRRRGVRALVLCPGATRTNFFVTAGEGAQLGQMRTSEAVVQTALRAYDRGASYVVDGPLNRILAFSPRFMPRPAIARIAALMMKPRSTKSNP
jgi:short-subunit dehydrogenase